MASKKPPSSVFVTDAVLRDLRPAKNFSYHDGASVTSLDFDDSGQYLISAGVDKSIQLYDCHKGLRVKDIQSQKYGAHLARFSHNELNCLYVSTPVAGDPEADHSIRYLSLNSKSYLRYFRGHKDQIVSLDMNPVGDTFVSASADHTVKTWDLRTSTAMGSIGVGQPSLVAHDPHGLLFVVAKPPVAADSPGSLELYSMASFERGPFLRVSVTTAGEAWTKVEFSNNGRLVLVGTDSSSHYVLDSVSGEVAARLDVAPDTGLHWMQFQYSSTGAVCFSPDGKYVLAGSPSGAVAIFDLSPLKSEPREFLVLRPIASVPSKQGIPKVLAFNPKLINLATADNTVVLWNTPLDD